MIIPPYNQNYVRWKLVSMQQNVLGGSARNFGVRESSGDVLFFCDSDDLYLERHIAVAFSSLIRKPTVAMVRLSFPAVLSQILARSFLLVILFLHLQIQTHAKIELENIHPKWKEKVEGTIPLTRCLWRKVHEFMEGYPEQGVFTRHQDVGYLLAFAATGAPMAIASEVLVLLASPSVLVVVVSPSVLGNCGLQEVPWKLARTASHEVHHRS